MQSKSGWVGSLGLERTLNQPYSAVCCPLVSGTCSSASPAGVEEDVDEGGGDGWQRVRVQRHDAELVLGDHDWMNCGLNGCQKNGGRNVNRCLYL